MIAVNNHSAGDDNIHYRRSSSEVVLRAANASFTRHHKGNEVDMLIEKRGPKAEPLRKISRHVKKNCVIPEHLEVLEGQLRDLERLLVR
jgi:hypothetical protein